MSPDQPGSENGFAEFAIVYFAALGAFGVEDVEFGGPSVGFATFGAGYFVTFYAFLFLVNFTREIRQVSVLQGDQIVLFRVINLRQSVGLSIDDLFETVSHQSGVSEVFVLFLMQQMEVMHELRFQFG